jgi:glycosyltransferase involved in cell wall biosynthesis
MIIVGNISPDGIDYYKSLRRLTKKYRLEDFIRFETSASFSRLVELMQRSKVYLHPMPGEPFGISTVEAMSAGLIPVVPDLGGHTEFVPSRFQFHTYGEGVDAVAQALNAPATERLWMSHRASSFSVPRFVAKFKETVSKLMEIYDPPTGTPPLMPPQRVRAESA